MSLTGGLRETRDSRALIAQNYRGGTCRIPYVGGVPITPCEKAVQADFSALTYNLSADWKITRKLLVYVATRRGYRAGGFVNAAALPSEFTAYRPETVTDYEIGLKSEYKIGTMAGRTNISL